MDTAVAFHIVIATMKQLLFGATGYPQKVSFGYELTSRPPQRPVNLVFLSVSVD